MGATQPRLVENGERPGVRAVLFVLSVVTGLVGQVVPHAAALFVASGVIFGAAMMGVGRQVLLAATAAPRNEASTVDTKTVC